MEAKTSPRSPWLWVPSLYFAEGIPLIIIQAVSVIMYKKMGISNADIALFTGWLYLPWVIKGLWSPFIDIYRTKRFWITLTQFVMGAGFACVAFVIPMPLFFQLTFMLFWLLAFNSATHDIAADGFYILGLDEHDQVWFCGIRNTFYRLATIAAQGLLVMFAGYVEGRTGLPERTVEVSSLPVAAMSLGTAVKAPEAAAPGGGMHLAVSGEKLEIPTVKLNTSEKDGICKTADEWNSGRLDVLPPEISFGKEMPDLQKYSGNLGILFIGLSEAPKPDQKVIVTFGRESGSKNISLLKGDRAEFTDKNWRRPLMAVIQLDPKLKDAESAKFAVRAGNVTLSWTISFILLAAVYSELALYHLFILPHPAKDAKYADAAGRPTAVGEFLASFKSFFSSEGILPAMAFLLLYRLGESQLLKLSTPFMLDAQEKGGLALTTQQVGFVYGTLGICALLVGGLTGSFLAAKDGLRGWIWPMALAINVPDLVYVYMAYCQPDSFLIISACVVVEQLGYGVGFTGYMLFMVYFVENSKFKASHYAIMTGFMALGMMLPGMASGKLQEMMGYKLFFIWVCISTVPGFIALCFLKINPEFGKKKKGQVNG